MSDSLHELAQAAPEMTDPLHELAQAAPGNMYLMEIRQDGGLRCNGRFLQHVGSVASCFFGQQSQCEALCRAPLVLV